MKNTTMILVAVIIVLAIVTAGLTIFSLTEKSDRAIDVTGTSSITRPADKATLSIGVETQAEDAQEAEAENTEITNQLYSALEDLGLTSKDYKTESFNIYPNRDYRGSSGEITGYTVRHSISIDTDKIEKVPDILDAAVGAGANNIYGINFGLKEETREMARAEAYKKATTFAKAKADSIAEGLGVRITGITRVRDTSYDFIPYRAEVAMADVAEKGALIQVEPGEVTVTARISVSYAFR